MSINVTIDLINERAIAQCSQEKTNTSQQEKVKKGLVERYFDLISNKPELCQLVNVK